MKQSIDPKIGIGIIVVIILVVLFFAWKQFAPKSGTVTAAEAGLGKPVYPHIPAGNSPSNPAPGQGGAPAAPSNGP